MPQADLPTSWSLLQGAAAGDDALRSQFASRYEAAIRNYLRHRWRGQPALEHLEDAVQDTFLECLKPGGVLVRAEEGKGEFRALLYGVVRNVARRHEEKMARSFHRRAGAPSGLDQVPADAEGLSTAFDRAWAQAVLQQAAHEHRAAAQLAGDDAVQRQEILRLRHDESLPVREIAARIGVDDVDSVHNDYRRARREFSRHLKKVLQAHTGSQGSELEAQLRRLPELISRK